MLRLLGMIRDRLQAKKYLTNAEDCIVQEVEEWGSGSQDVIKTCGTCDNLLNIEDSPYLVCMAYDGSIVWPSAPPCRHWKGRIQSKEKEEKRKQ